MEQALRRTERVLLALGAACLIWVGLSVAHVFAYQRAQGLLLDRVILAREHPHADPMAAVPARLAPAGLIGRLEIPRLGLSAIVVDGDDDRTLDIAVGHLPDTPLPWQEGNAALAGHRDTFFRPLRRIQPGDEIQIETGQGTFRYRVTRKMVVEPNDLRVLEPSPAAALTLITCYPFDFVGPAPRRFVVHAARIAGATSGVSRHGPGHGQGAR
jgi:sortase A